MKKKQEKKEYATLLRHVRTKQGWRRKVVTIGGPRNWEQRLNEFATYGPDVTALGEYQIRWNEKKGGKSCPCYESAGEDYAEAKIALKEREGKLELVRLAKDRGIELPPELAVDDKVSLGKRLEAYLTKRQAKGKITSGGTLGQYRFNLEEFLSLAGVVYAEDVTEETLQRYLLGLKKSGLDLQTMAHKYSQIAALLRTLRSDLHNALKEYAPKPPKKPPVSYDAKDIAELFAYLDSQPDFLKLALALEMDLLTGLRKRELTHLPWEMVKLETGFVEVKNNQIFKFTDKRGKKVEITFLTKSRKDRKVPIEQALLEKLRHYHELHPDDRFLFPTSTGRPDGHILRTLRRATSKATAEGVKLNCGVCDACTSPCKMCQYCRCRKCKHCRGPIRNRRACQNPQVGHAPCTRVECKKWRLHRLRHTFATMSMRSGKVDVHMLQGLLGHASLGPTQVYLSAAKEAETQAAINGALSGLRPHAPLPSL